ncbi:MAG: MBL fold metallo-hydrolase [Clostridia bacterium]|nr:MBL fold metallo-hydrolase [Clostridia bacterium]
MKLTFLGADHEVTGSCTLIENCGHYMLVDYGMEQGINIFENMPLPVSPADIDCVLLTHAHIDHSGNLPLLYKNGFKGTVYATEATCNLCEIMLLDTAHIQEQEAQWKSRKSKRAGGKEVEPVFDVNDAQGVLQKFRACPYDTFIQINEGVSVRFTDIGHLLGSASIEIDLTENGVTKRVVFSGDVGNTNQPIIKDPQQVHCADCLIIESTYGNRYHGERPDYVGSLAEIIQRTFDRGGNVVVPAFAVGRTQEMLYFLRIIQKEGRIKGHDNFKIYVDSPLANEATDIFLQCDDKEYFDDETRALIDAGINPLYSPGLRVSITDAESKMINSDPDPKVIISASGMCDAGRIRHHLKHNLWREECTVLFVGYQAVGTLGRILVDGASEVKIFGERIAVNAEIEFLDGISGHADKQGLLDWIDGFDQKPGKVFVNHGEDTVCMEFTSCLIEEKGIDAFAPYSGTRYNVLTGEIEFAPEGIKVINKDGKKASRSREVFNRLLVAAQRLLEVAKSYEGAPNKDIARFADQINSLCDKWR